jgi:hypothetical protein
MTNGMNFAVGEILMTTWYFGPSFCNKVTLFSASAHAAEFIEAAQSAKT